MNRTEEMNKTENMVESEEMDKIEGMDKNEEMDKIEGMDKNEEMDKNAVSGDKKSGGTADYKNWIPKGMIAGFAAGTAALGCAGVAASYILKDAPKNVRAGTCAVLGTACAAGAAVTGWLGMAYEQFAYDGGRQLSKTIIDGTAAYLDIPDGGVALDVGCGSGALAIACAKRNPDAEVIGIDRWGKEYASFSKALCEENAKAEGVGNISFQNGDAVKLDFGDETFDAVTSNYVYHNIGGYDKQELLRETLRVLKKGGTFAIHDIMSYGRYGDMDEFVEELKAEGYEEARLIRTDDGLFMTKKEARIMFLTGSTLLAGRK